MSEGGEAEEGGYSMRCNMQPPNLNNFKCYEDFRDRVTLWKLTTDQKSTKLGLILANALPDISKKFGDNIATSLLKKHKAETLYAENGLQIVLDYLDAKLGKTELLEEIHAFAGIDCYFRQPDQGIVQFVNEFDLRYNTCITSKVDIQDSIAAYMLLRRAKLTNTQYELVKGVLDQKKESDEGLLYEKVKKKMVDMLTDSLGVMQNEPEKETISEESAFIAAHHEEAFATWRNKKKWNQPYKGKEGKNNYDKYGANKSGFSKSKDSNPLDSAGRVMRCRECGAWNHLVKDCPSKKGKSKTFQKYYKQKDGKQVYMVQCDTSDDESKDESEEEAYITVVMFTTNREDLSRFTAEAINCAALDSCCTATVAGKKWLNIFLEALPKDMKKLVQGPLPSGKTFMFGNEGKMTAGESYNIPIKIAGKIKMIHVDIIESDIPLLLSKGEMKTLGMTLDMKNDAAYANGKPLKVSTTSAGHFIIDLIDQDEASVMEEICVIDLLKVDRDTQAKLLQKIHKQFGHRPKRVFVDLLKDAGKW